MTLWSYSNIKLGHEGFHLDYIVNISIFSQQFHLDNKCYYESTKDGEKTENENCTTNTKDSTDENDTSDDRIKSNKYLVLLPFPSNVYLDRNELVSI